MEKRQGSIAAEDREEAQRRLQEIGCQILRASRDVLHGFWCVSIWDRREYSLLSPLAAGRTVPAESNFGKQRVPAYGAALYFSSYDKAGDGW